MPNRVAAGVARRLGCRIKVCVDSMHSSRATDRHASRHYQGLGELMHSPSAATLPGRPSEQGEGVTPPTYFFTERANTPQRQDPLFNVQCATKPAFDSLLSDCSDDVSQCNGTCYIVRMVSRRYIEVAVSMPTNVPFIPWVPLSPLVLNSHLPNCKV